MASTPLRPEARSQIARPVAHGTSCRHLWQKRTGRHGPRPCTPCRRHRTDLSLGEIENCVRIALGRPAWVTAAGGPRRVCKAQVYSDASAACLPAPASPTGLLRTETLALAFTARLHWMHWIVKKCRRGRADGRTRPRGGDWRFRLATLDVDRQKYVRVRSRRSGDAFPIPGWPHYSKSTLLPTSPFRNTPLKISAGCSSTVLSR